MSSESTVHVLGVRHHGPGSARSVRAALAAIRPDAVLVEGPPDADALIPFATDAGMEPPVALLVYRPDRPRVSVFYPFAEFSPEWQAITYAIGNGGAVRFMDLPIAHQFGQAPDDDEAPAGEEPGLEEGQEPPDVFAGRVRVDPLRVLAEAAGYDDGERWWEHAVEHRRDGADVFDAVAEAMTAVRDSVPPTSDLRELLREAHMRQTIRAAQAEGRRNIAVVCGAWHAPALLPERWPNARDDAALLKGLPKVKVEATWVPWTHGRLSSGGGYGAGVESPGWYHHLWSAPDQVVNRWMTRVARLLRDEGLDASSASVIESVRLAEALAALRGRSLPGLAELDEATRSIFCSGDDTPMRLIRRKLTVGEALGRVPRETPGVPLQKDLERLQKSLKLPPDPTQATKTLDLRNATDLDRSRLLHRLDLLGIPWGKITHASGKGTFKEAWQLQWHPEFAVDLIAASVWGSTVLDAAAARARDDADQSADLPALTTLLDRAILADLPDAVEHVMRCVESQAAVAGDVTQLMNALPPLSRLIRYGNVRKTDAAMVAHAAGGMISRVCVGLPLACSSLDDAAASAMFDAVNAADAAVRLIDDADHLADWRATLAKMSDSDRLHQLLAGRCCRVLLDAQVFDPAEVARRMGLAVSVAAEPAHAAAWVEGFLKGSGEVLVHDDAVFGILDDWLAGLPGETFMQTLPLLRRTFSTFEAPLRRNLGEKARRKPAPVRAGPAPGAGDFDEARAAGVLPLLAKLLGCSFDAEGG